MSKKFSKIVAMCLALTSLFLTACKGDVNGGNDGNNDYVKTPVEHLQEG